MSATPAQDPGSGPPTIRELDVRVDPRGGVEVPALPVSVDRAHEVQVGRGHLSSVPHRNAWRPCVACGILPPCPRSPRPPDPIELTCSFYETMDQRVGLRCARG